MRIEVIGIIFLAGVVLAVSSLPGEGETIYRYVDQEGRLHFSNIPSDSRYRPWFNNNRWGDSKTNYRRLRGLIERMSQEHRINPDLLKAIIKVESDFDPWAVSHKGAMGLMQLMPGTAERWGVDRPFDPRENLEGGIRHFKFLMEQFDGDLIMSLAAYNAGEKRVTRQRKIPPIKETRQYVRMVIREFKRFQKQRIGE